MTALTPAQPAEPGALDPEVDAMMYREMAGLLQVLYRIRLVVLGTLVALAALIAVVEPVTWRLLVLVGAATVLGGLAFVDGPAPAPYEAVGVGRIQYTLVYVVLLHSALIGSTGGVGSPLIVLYIPVAVLSGITLGRARYFAVVLAVQFTFLLLFAATAQQALDGAPTLLFTHATAHYSDAYLWSFAGFLALVCTLSAIIGAFVRRALFRAIVTATLARKEAVATMRERNRELTDLAGALAHELKNPLSSIQGLAGLLTKKLPAGSREAEQMGVLLSEARRMGGILDEFLNFSRPAQPLTVHAADPNALVREVVLLHEGSAASRGVTLLAEPAAQLQVGCDARKVHQVLVNLVQNAIDATPLGGRITVAAATNTQGGAVFQVTDTGPGLAAEVRGRLFTAGVTSKASGTGLGLVISRAIVQQHGGSLVIDDGPGGVGCRAVFDISSLPESKTLPESRPLPEVTP